MGSVQSGVTPRPGSGIDPGRSNPSTRVATPRNGSVQPGGAPGPGNGGIAGNRPGGRVSTCQHCHMQTTSGYIASTNLNPGIPVRTNMAVQTERGTLVQTFFK